MDNNRAMCSSCPFRQLGDARTTLLRFIAVDPTESWPCHESDPEGLCLGHACAGRDQFAPHVERILAR